MLPSDEARAHAIELRRNGVPQAEIAKNLEIAFLLPPATAAAIARVACSARPDGPIPPSGYRDWLFHISTFRGGWRGGAVILATLAATALGGWAGAAIVTSGQLPRLILAIPGLLGGGLMFFGLSALIWVVSDDWRR